MRLPLPGRLSNSPASIAFRTCSSTNFSIPIRVCPPRTYSLMTVLIQVWRVGPGGARGNLYDRTFRYNAVLRNDNYSIAYKEAVALELLMTGFIQDLHALANPRVLVDDRAANHAVGAD